MSSGLNPQNENAVCTTQQYLQQLTIAALQGLCANPAHCTRYDDLPYMADWLARGIIRIQEAQSEN